MTAADSDALDQWSVVRHALDRAPLARIPVRRRDEPRKLNRTELMTLTAALSMTFEPTRPTLDRLIDLVGVKPVEVCRSLEVLARYGIFNAGYGRGPAARESRS